MIGTEIGSAVVRVRPATAAPEAPDASQRRTHTLQAAITGNVSERIDTLDESAGTTEGGIGIGARPDGMPDAMMMTDHHVETETSLTTVLELGAVEA